MALKMMGIALTFFVTMHCGVKPVEAHNPHDIVAALLASDDGKFALAMSRGVMYRTLDGGFSWDEAHGGLPLLKQHNKYTLVSTPLASATDTSDSAIFLLANNFRAADSLEKSALFRSNDLGSTWTNVWSGDSKIAADLLTYKAKQHKMTVAAPIALSPNFLEDKTMVIAGEQLLVSTDGGVTFEAKEGKHEFTTVLATPHGIVAGTNNGTVFFSSMDHSPSLKSLSYSHGNEPISSLQSCGAAVADNVCILAGSIDGVAKLVVDKSLTTLHDRKLILDADQLSPSKAGPQLAAQAPKFTNHMKEVLILPYGSENMLVTTHVAALLTDTDGKKWTSLGDEHGLHFTLTQLLEFKVPQYSHLVYSRKAGKMWVGSYTGIYASDDQGRSWVKLDVINPHITSLDVTKGGHGPVVSVCTYTAGCFGKELSTLSTQNTASVDDLPRMSVLMKSAGRPEGELFQRYLLQKMSPNFQDDKLVFVSGRKVGLLRSTDGGATWSKISVPTGASTGKDANDVHGKVELTEQIYTIHSMEFSPNFRTDGTLFVSGFNVDGGLAISTDRGQTFKRFPHWGRNFSKFASHCKLSLSPDFSYNQSTGRGHGSMLLSFADDEMLGGGKNTQYAWQERPSLMSTLQVSRDGGGTFNTIAQGFLADGQFLNNDDVIARELTEDCVTNGDVRGLVCGGFLSIHTRNGNSFEKLHDVADLSRNGMHADPSTGTVVAATQSGKIYKYTIENGSVKFVEQQNPTVSFRIGQSLLPPDDSLRGMGTLLKAYEGGVYFGASANRILLSEDYGKTWRVVAKVPQNIAKGGSDACAFARNSELPAMRIDSSYPSYNDDGAYCLKCYDGYKRHPDTGTCGENFVQVRNAADVNPDPEPCDYFDDAPTHEEQSAHGSTGRFLKVKPHA